MTELEPMVSILGFLDRIRRARTMPELDRIGGEMEHVRLYQASELADAYSQQRELIEAWEIVRPKTKAINEPRDEDG